MLKMALQVQTQGFRGFVALRGIVCRGPLHDRIQVTAQARAPRHVGSKFTRTHLGLAQQGDGVVVGIHARAPSRQQLEQDQAQRIHVAGSADRLATQLLGTRVQRRDPCACRPCLARGGLLVERARNAEIKQHRIAIGAHQHIGRLQVAMHDQALMGKLHGITNLAEKAQARFQIQLLSGAVTLDRNALDVFHHQIGLPTRRRATIKQAGDVRMLQPGQDLPLAREVQEGFRIGHAADQFDRHALVEVSVAAFGQEHRAHATAADLLEQAPGAEAVTGVQFQRVLRRIARTWRLPVAPCGGFRIGHQARIDLGDQQRIRAQLQQALVSCRFGQVTYLGMQPANGFLMFVAAVHAAFRFGLASKRPRPNRRCHWTPPPPQRGHRSR